MKFSANLGFLWTELDLAAAIRAAATAGFGAVECHFPYDQDPGAVAEALAESGLPMLGLNTIRGDVAAGDFGLSAVPDRISEARAAIDQALTYARRIKARNIHVMAGKALGETARRCYLDNLAYASDKAGELDILIEPINTRDVPGYHLSNMEDAAGIVATLNRPNIRVMADCYHTQIMQGDLTRRITTHLDVIGHIQIAAVPNRAEPDQGEIAYHRLLPALMEAGYQGWFGAEYKPAATTEDGLGWLRDLAP